MTSSVHVNLDHNRIAILTFDRPETRNALNWQMMDAFLRNIETISKDPTIDVIILTGADGAFCAGGDLFELHNYRSYADGKRLAKLMGDALCLIMEVPIPVLAAIEGPAIGGGAEIALACDLRVVSRNARIGLSQINLALTPAWGGAGKLIRHIGYQQAFKLLSTGEILDANTALELGLVNRVVRKGHALGMSIEIAQDLNKKDPNAMRALKDVLRAHMMLPASEARAFERSTFAKLWASQAHIMAATRYIERKGMQ